MSEFGLYRYAVEDDPEFDRCVVIDDGETGGDFWSRWYQPPWGTRMSGSYDPVHRYRGNFGMTLTLPGGQGDRSGPGFLAKRAQSLVGMNALRMWVRPDGTGNRVSLGIQDFSNELWWVTVGDLLSGTEPYILQVPLVDLTRCQVIRRNNGVMDLHQFVSFFFWIEGGYSFSFDELMIVHDPALAEFDPEIARAPLVGEVYKINCGGTLASEFSADCAWFYGDDSVSAGWTSIDDVDVTAIDDPGPQLLYQTARYSLDRHMTYTLPHLDPGAVYRLRLHFCELIEQAPRRRVQDVRANGEAVAQELDIVAEAGGPQIAVVKEIEIAADAEGRIVLELDGLVGNAMINGIELVSPTPGITPWSTPGYAR